MHVSKIYLETALVNLKALKAQKDYIIKDEELEFGLSAATITFSYAAIEAFVNHQLNEDWKYSIEWFSDNKPDIKLRGYDYKQLSLFYNRYKEIESLDHLLKLNDLKEVKNKMNLLCKNQGIPTVFQSNEKLWNDFCNLLRECRNFIIHINSDLENFDRFTKTILDKETVSKCIAISSNMIAHFYVARNQTIPEYLKKFMDWKNL